MIEVKTFVLPEVIPQSELQQWKANIHRVEAPNCPAEVRQFIDALALKLADFAQIGKERTMISGRELLLAGMKELEGEPINTWTIYPLPIPRMVAVDHNAAMHRIFNRKGKQGLIDFCKAKVRGTELERLLTVLSVNVFKEERPEFKKVMADINASKKLDG